MTTSILVSKPAPRVACALATLLFLHVSSSTAREPRWWSERKVKEATVPNILEKDADGFIVPPGVLKKDANGFVLPGDDFSVVNQAQIKNFVRHAFEEFSQKLAPFPGGLGDMRPPAEFPPQGGTGWRITALKNSVMSSLKDPSNGIAANQGQGKAAAQPFWDRLKELGAAVQYPWEGNGAPAADFGLLNSGQLKALFAFSIDEDGDGMLDGWEERMFGSLFESSDGDFDRDGVINIHERTARTPPNDFYNNTPPQIEIVSGNNQIVLPNRVLPIKLGVRLRRVGDQQPLANAPLSFQLTAGQLSRDKQNWIELLTTATDASGISEAHVEAPAAGGLHSVLVRAGPASLAVPLTVKYDLGPAAPILTEIVPDVGKLHIRWTDPPSSGAVSFDIERSTDQRRWVILKTVPATVTTYTDPVLSGVEYFYRVTSK